jgi:hypothetical protein
MEQSAVKQKVGTLTTVEMVEREGEQPEIELLTHGEELPTVETLIRVLGALRGELHPPASAAFPTGLCRSPSARRRAGAEWRMRWGLASGFGWLWTHRRRRPRISPAGAETDRDGSPSRPAAPDQRVDLSSPFGDFEAVLLERRASSTVPSDR